MATGPQCSLDARTINETAVPSRVSEPASTQEGRWNTGETSPRTRVLASPANTQNRHPRCDARSAPRVQASDSGDASYLALIRSVNDVLRRRHGRREAEDAVPAAEVPNDPRAPALVRDRYERRDRSGARRLHVLRAIRSVAMKDPLDQTSSSPSAGWSAASRIAPPPAPVTSVRCVAFPSTRSSTSFAASSAKRRSSSVSALTYAARIGER